MSDHSELLYIFKCMEHMRAGKHGKAFRTFTKGLERNLASVERIKSQDLLNALLLLATEIESSLERDFGVHLVAVSKPQPKLVVTCGYCGRRKSETKLLMGGGGGPICDRCAKEFNDFAEAATRAKAANRAPRRGVRRS